METTVLNPYAFGSDQKDAQRGCYHYDQWFARTPPIKGVYDDYGRCNFKEGPITDLIVDCFKKDAIERPFGFNQYHACDVTPSKGINHLLQAAWQGRLIVQDDYTRDKREAPKHWPTWQRVQAILKEHKFPIQSEGKEDSGKAGYNAQPVIPGVVCVTFNSYDDNRPKLKKAQKILQETYYCEMVSQFKDRPEYHVCLIVAPLGVSGHIPHRKRWGLG